MSWPSIWQNQNQAPTNQADMATGNMFMSLEQHALQQQSWQQWQIYQAQLTQWQAQYGDQMNSQAMVSNVFMQNMYPGAIPPLPVENKPPPPPIPPPPSSSTTTTVLDPNAGQSIQTGILQQHQQQQQQSLITSNNQKPAVEPIQPHMPSNVNTQPESAESSTQESFEPNVNRFNENNRRNINQDNDDNSYSNWRNKNSRNDRNWIQNNKNQKRNQNQFASDSNSSYRSANFENENRGGSKLQTGRQNLADVKSQEEIEFDEQYRIWEEQFDQWKLDNENHQDGQRYNDFLKQMENCRNKMLQKREMLRKKRLKSFGISDSPPPQQHSQTENNSKREMDDSKSLFGSNDSGGIPGLDLVHGGTSSKNEPLDTKSEVQSTAIADINQILDDPNIKSLLSNIQMQQKQHKKHQQQNEMQQFNEKRNDRFQAKKMDSIGQPSGSGESMGQRNLFRNKNYDNFADNSGGNQQFDNNDFDERPMKRECRWNDEHVDGVQQLNRSQQEDRNFSRERMQSHIQSFDAQSFRNNRKRPRNDDQSYFDESVRNLNEFRPVQIFDYQNQRQNPPRQQLPAFVQQPAFTSSRALQLQHDLDFPRRVIDYIHKSKKFNFKEFCPIVQMDYDHKNKPISLHEHPPIKRPIKNEIKKEVKVEACNQSCGSRGSEFMQLRQPKWENRPKPWQQQPMPPLQRKPYSNQASHQERYEDERFDYRYSPSNDYQYQRSMDNQSYYNNRNQQERHWQSRDLDDLYNREKRPQNTASTSSAPYNKAQATTSASFIQTEPPAIKINEQQKKDIKDLLFPPGRRIRPAKLAILLRGPPGAGKSFIAKTIKEKECEMNGSVRILSIDDYFTTESDEQSNGKMIYEYDAAMEDKYMQCLAKSFRKTLIDRLFDVIIVDCNNITLEYLNDFHSSALVHQYTPYVCEMPLDVEKCLKNNIHNRTASDIKKAITSWVPTPTTYTLLKYESLFNDADATEEISDNENEPGVSDALDAISDEDGQMSGQNYDDDDDDDGNSFDEFGCFKSKWDNDSTENKLARLDGTNKPMKHATIEEYLQMDGWEPPPSSSNGKKRVRWADIEEKREQDKQRAIGFVVGQTNWDNLLDQPRDRRDGSTALIKIKYIEKVNKR